MAKMTPVSMTPAELVAVRRTRRHRPAETNALLGHVLASLEESAKARLSWDDAWAKATADGVEPYVRYLTPRAQRIYAVRLAAAE